MRGEADGPERVHFREIQSATSCTSQSGRSSDADDVISVRSKVSISACDQDKKGFWESLEFHCEISRRAGWRIVPALKFLVRPRMCATRILNARYRSSFDSLKQRTAFRDLAVVKKK